MNFRSWKKTEIANRIHEIHVDARFDVVKNKGFWLLGNDEKEINSADWFQPEEGFVIDTKQPNNPNLLAIRTGCTSYPGLFIREWLIESFNYINKVKPNISPTITGIHGPEHFCLKTKLNFSDQTRRKRSLDR